MNRPLQVPQEFIKELLIKDAHDVSFGKKKISCQMKKIQGMIYPRIKWACFTY